MTLAMAFKRYLAEISPTKKPSTQRAEATKAQKLISHLDKYSMAALSAEIIAKYRDARLASITNPGKPTSNNIVRLELTLLSHLFIEAIQEWGLDMTSHLHCHNRQRTP
jgi:hypothetical protein